MLWLMIPLFYCLKYFDKKSKSAQKVWFYYMLDLAENQKTVLDGVKLELFIKNLLYQLRNTDNVLTFEKIRAFIKNSA